MSELRRGVIDVGECVEGAAPLFADLDAGRAQPEEIEQAIQICRQCQRLPECEQLLGDASLQDTVVAGTYVRSELPDAGPAARRRSYRERDKRHLGYKEFLPTPDWYLDEFAEAHKAGSGYMRSVRALLQQEPYIFRATRIAERMRPVATWLGKQSLAAGERLPAADTKAALSSIAAVFVRTRDSFRIRKHPGLPNESEGLAVVGLANEYLETAEGMLAMGLRNVGRIALRHNLTYCRDVFERFSGIPGVTDSLIRDAFDRHSNPAEMLDRYVAWLAEVSQQHRGNPALPRGILQALVARAARTDDRTRVDEFIDGYLARYEKMQELCTHLPFVRDHHVRALALGNSSPEMATQALHKRVAALSRLAVQYGVDRLGVQQLSRLYRGNADVSLQTIEYFAAHASEPRQAVDQYLHGLARLRDQFSGKPEFDDETLQQIARYHREDAMAGAHAYIAAYRRLLRQYASDEHIDDWLLRQAAARRPSNCEASLAFLKSAVQSSLLSINQQEPEGNRIRIGKPLLALGKAEREAVIYMTGLDWLFDGAIASRANVAKELMVPLSQLDAYTHRTILPKLR